MARQTFSEFLARGLPFGDVVDRPFIYDALRDTDFPDAESWDEVESYMSRRDPDTAPATLKAVQLLGNFTLRNARSAIVACAKLRV
jgi:hypothetical protein